MGGAVSSPRREAPRRAAIGAALLRISMGLLFLGHVGVRLTIIGWPAAQAFFGSLGLPPVFAPVLAYAVTTIEAAVGLSLLVGWRVRAAAPAGAIILIGATLLVHGPNGFLFTNPGGGWEYPVFWAIALGCQSLLGAGCWSIDGGSWS